MTCTICESRKAKRHCPALRSEICAQCCGQGREETIDCPLDCVYLVEGREHERRPGLSPGDFPYKEIRITDTFLRQNEDLLTAAARGVLDSAFTTAGAVDGDVREALDALGRTYKSLESGVYYETTPGSPVAAAIARQVQERLQAFRNEQTQQAGMTRTRDTDVFGILVFLLRMAIDRDNGKKRGRSFLDFLRQHFPTAQPAPASSSLIVPG